VKELVLDANTLIHGKGNLPNGEYVTTPEVAEEIKSDKSKNIYENKDIKIHSASQDAIEKVQVKSTEINSPTSMEDESIVALALERDSTVVSDDKAVQNLALLLEVDFQSFMEDRVDESRKWETKCMDCGSEVSGGKCGVCGSSNIERKPI